MANSRVDTGRFDRHPVKRLRTSLTYLAVALFGTASERQAMRGEVNRCHRPVRSSASDPVKYSAFDPALQLWVAACLYRGLEMLYRTLRGVPDETTADVLYRHGARFGTTLQVDEEDWPADRAAFDRYWNDALGEIRMDDVTRSYLLGLAGLSFLPPPVRWTLGPAYRFSTAGFLPEPFREELGVRWTGAHQAAFGILVQVAARLTRAAPPVLQEFPLNVCLWDCRRRLAAGIPVI